MYSLHIPSWYLLILAGMLLILATCKKETVTRPFPRTLTGEVTDISREGVRFHGEILALGREPVTDHGFVLDEASIPALDKSKVFSLGPCNKAGEFEVYATIALKNGTKYSVSSYAKTEHYVVYGDVIHFVSQGSNPPVITNFSPQSGAWGDTVEIHGKYFADRPEYDLVCFDTIKATVLRASDTSLTVTVPFSLLKESSHLSVEVFGSKTISEKNFTLLVTLPTVNEIKPDHGFYKDTIEIHGSYFDSRLKVFLDTQAVQIIDISRDLILFKVPAHLPEGHISLKLILGDFNVNFPDVFYSSAPVFSKITPEKGTFRDTLTLRGKNFHQERSDRQITIDNISSPIVDYSDTLIRFIIPDATSDEVPSIKLSIDNLSFPVEDKFKGLYLPVIDDISPDTVFFNQYFYIHGKFFNPVPSRNKVSFGGVQSYPVNGSTTRRLKVLVPPSVKNVPDGKLTVDLTIGKMKAPGTHYTIIPAPVISHISPDSGTVGNNISVTGDNFNSFWGSNKIIIESPDTTITFQLGVTSRTSGFFTLPEMTPVSTTLYVTVAGQKSKPYHYVLKKIKITDVSPKALFKGCRITISGDGFHPESFYNTNQLNKVFLSILPNPIRIASATKTKITLDLPDQDFPSGPVTLTYRLGVQEIILEDYLYYHNPWSALTTLNMEQAIGFSTCMNGADVYMGVGTDGVSSDFWKYNIDANSLTKLPDYPVQGYGSTSFFLNNKVYVSAAVFDSINFPKGIAIFIFDPATSAWQQLDNIPDLHAQMIAFTLNNKAYIGLGHIGYTGFRDWYEYDPFADTWTRKSDFPGTLPSAASFMINDLEYVLTNNGELWTYNVAGDTWTQKSSVAFGTRSKIVAFSIGNKGYAGLGRNLSSGETLSDFWEYDSATDSWSSIIEAPEALQSAFFFSRDGKGYIGGGVDSQNHPNQTLYEFDPLKK